MPLWHVQQQDDITEGQIEYKKEKGNLLPVYQSGDRYLLLGAIAGVAAGIALTISSGNLFLIAGGVISGGVIGVLVGSSIGFLMARYANRKRK